MAGTGTDRPAPPASLLPFALAGGAYVVVLAAGRKLLNDPDSYWHLVVGRWILDHGFPHTDPFSFTMAGEPWIAKEWLSQLLYAGAESIGGWAGMAVLAAGAAALALGLLARLLLRHLAPLPVLVLSLAAFLLVTPHLLARPHALALPVLVAWTGGLVAAVDERRAPSPWLLGLLVLWANLHSSFIVGIALAGAFAIDALVSAPAEERRRVLVPWVRFGVLAVLAACITPYGPGSLLAAGRVLSVGDSLAIIDEWKPADFSTVSPLELVLVAGVAMALLRGVRLPLVRIVLLLGVAHLALSAVRNADVLGLVAPLLLAAPLARQYPSIAAPARRVPVPRGAWPALAALVPLTVVLLSARPVEPARRVSPVAAVAAIQAADPGRVFNAYDFGGYLVYAGVPTFIDGRTELYPSSLVLGSDAALRLTDLPGLVSLLDEYDIGATLLPPAAPAVAYLDRDPAWERLYADDVAVVHVRR